MTGTFTPSLFLLTRSSLDKGVLSWKFWPPSTVKSGCRICTPPKNLVSLQGLGLSVTSVTRAVSVPFALHYIEKTVKYALYLKSGSEPLSYSSMV